MSYRPGDFWRACEQCGFFMRASASYKRWDGLWVCAADYEERHSQDYVRGRADNQNVPEPRPEPVDTIVGMLRTTLTANAAAGATSLSVELSTEMQSGDRVVIALSDGSMHSAILNSVPTSTSVTLTAATKLPNTALSGALMVNYSAVAEATIE